MKKHTLEEADFTRRQWEIIQKSNKSIYTCYSLIKKAKTECYPDKESMLVTETCSEIRLQTLLDHTALRLPKYAAEVVETCSEKEKQNMVLLSLDVSDRNKHSTNKNFENSTDSDANIFQSSLVPLRLVVIINGEQKKVTWQNPVPSCVRFCRPKRVCV